MKPTFLLCAAALLSLAAARVPAAEAPAPLLAQYLAEKAGAEQIVYVVRGRYAGGHAYETFGASVRATDFSQPLQCNWNKIVGSQLRLRDLRSGADRVLLEDPAGAIRNPCVSYDGKGMVLSYRPAADQNYHLHELDADGTGLRQITRGPYDDVEPSYLPDGGIVFTSSRARRYVPCFVTPVGLIYRCDPHGGNMRLLTCGVDHDLRPRVIQDGRIVFTRWEYIDITEQGRFDLWVMRPDGSGLAKLFAWELCNARPVPGVNQLVAVNCNKGTANQHGPLVMLDMGFDADAGMASRRGGAEAQAGRRTVVGGNGANWNNMNGCRDPYPVSARWAFFASPNGIELARLPSATDELPAREVVVATPTGKGGRDQQFCHDPQPLGPRTREPVLAPVTDWTRTTGRLVISDVYEGRRESIGGIERGAIKSLAVYEQLPTAIKFRDNTSGQVSMGSSWNLKRYLGTFPVEADGSAAVEVPARRDLQLVALDANGIAVKRMHAGFSVMPGETLSCIGCHDNRSRAPAACAAIKAMARPASALRVEPLAPPGGIVDYVRAIQPIWNKHCVSCHNADTWTGRLCLSANRGPFYNHGAFALVWRGQVSLAALRGPDGSPRVRGMGTPASPLLDKLRGGHHGAKLTAEEYRLVQIWIDGGGMYASHYACNDTGQAPMDMQAFGRAVEKTCTACHAKSPEFQAKHVKDGPHGNRRERFGDFTSLLVDVTEPGKSLLVRAPLPKSAGGLGWCRSPDGKPPFASRDDAGLKALAAMLPRPDAATGRVAVNSFELPGFQPVGAYLRTMQAYGALKADYDGMAPLDLQALEEAYQSLFHPGADDSGMSHLRP